MRKIWRALEFVANLMTFFVVLLVLTILFLGLLLYYPFAYCYYYWFVETRSDAAEENYTLREDQAP